jgi:PAS domain S-box-containing protein
VNEAYEQSDADRALLERSMDVTSQELMEVNRRLAEDGERVRRTLSLLQSALNSADGILVVDTGGRIVLHNEPFVRMWRIPKEVMAARDDSRAIAVALQQLSDPEGFLRRVCELYAQPEADSSDTLELKDGRVFARTSFPWRVDGEPAGRVWIFHDITYLRRAESALRLTQFSLDHAPEGVVWADAEGRVTYANVAAGRLLGRPRESLLGSPVWTFDSALSQGEWIAHWDEIKRAGTLTRATVYRRRDGATVPVEVTVSQVRFAQHDQVCAFVRDVTERRLLERQIREAQKMDAVGRLAGGVAHDFNNLLTAILGHAELLAMSLPEEDPRRADAEEIHKAGERAAGLTRQLLAFSRRQVLQPRDVDLNALVTDLQKMLRRLIGENVELCTRLEASRSHIKADPDQLAQVALNLVINARDAMPHGGGRITVATANVRIGDGAHPFEDAAPGDYVELRVEDTGAGMTEDVLAHIFEPFFTTKAPGKGTGLGLSTVYGIVRQSRGRVAVSSAPGRGTEFRVILPEHAGDAKAAPPAAAADTPTRGSGTVLLVEDDEAVRSLAIHGLKASGYRVLAAGHGVEAMGMLERESVDIVVTDLVMPVMGGLELARRVRERGGGPRFLFVSGYPDQMEACGVSLGETAFLPKPFTPDAIARKVREVLAAPRA